MPVSACALLNASISSLGYGLDAHWRGVLVKIWMQSQPICRPRACDWLTPPAIDTCATISGRFSFLEAIATCCVGGARSAPPTERFYMKRPRKRGFRGRDARAVALHAARGGAAHPLAHARRARILMLCGGWWTSISYVARSYVACSADA